MSESGGAGAVSSGHSVPSGAWWEWLRRGFEEQARSAAVRDPLLSAVEMAWEANPLHRVIPVNWAEVVWALQRLWMREMSDPGRAMQRAVDYNLRSWSAAVESWNAAVSRAWGLPTPEERERRPDRRFSAPEWEHNPYYRMLKETYLLASEYLMREAEETAGEDEEEERRLRFHLRQFVEAMAPVNFLLTNPAALRRVMETGGESLTAGVRNLLEDIRRGRLSMTDMTAFELGKDLAATPGKVVYRSRLIELIQYEPRTEKVHEVPLLWIPPWINKYYILDLRPENSFVRYMLERGFTLFMISWKNPDASMEETTFEDYMNEGPLRAAEVVSEITGSETVNPMGYCIGGTLLAMTLAYLAAGGEGRFGPATFIVSLLDFSDVGDTAVFIDEPQIDFIEQQMMERGYLEGRALYNMFNLLRPTDLIWSSVVNNYLMGQKPPAFDLLYWNSDSTRMARAAHGFYLRNTYLENNLVKPGKVRLGGRPIDLGRISGEVYAVGAEKDHIVPWESAWKISKLTGARVRFVLASSGHVAGIINPPAKGKGRHWVNEKGDAGAFETAEEWRENASEREGSWWTDWARWLAGRCGEKTEPPPTGSEKYPPIEDAPGTYVRERDE
ncbi:class I poly(R)-hydroxyalkanoic acid synthase [Rubrobacter xylanophilus]|uniref:Class I poly(R)-hydroxyalkanoic acid synthase n=1 Tax=Rubrobacter xylanophilus TaxID=49319 RepID=A0A510HMS0_9ACTN|nr:class I poly(R)-hydroxyalkanoic acid synthase [Rubrobacter xylanophilus]BBL79737.1 class I poly(R)-hydroxyalkanoic acid synthase [Rubrobacter xylanophilus]